MMDKYEVLQTLHEGNHQVLKVECKESQSKLILKTPRQLYLSQKDIRQFFYGVELTQAHTIEGVLRHEVTNYLNNRPALIVADSGFVSLDRQPLPGNDILKPALDIFSQLAGILKNVHASGIVHHSLNPSHILVEPVSHKVALIGFSHAVKIDQASASLSPLEINHKSRPYVAPERNSSSNHLTDIRSDLYSMGVILFQLLTGRLPGIEDGAGSHIHSPGEIPDAMTAIVEKLMAIDPNERYQDVQELEKDLQQVRDQTVPSGPAMSLQDQQTNSTGEFHIPTDFLYGRDQELNTLKIKRQAIKDGQTTAVLINGAPGTGKTSLATHLQAEFIADGGCFVPLCYLPSQQNVPYSAITLFFDHLIHQILGKDQKTVADLQAEILEKLDGNARLMIDFIPSLEMLIGPQPVVSETGPAETRIRLQQIFVTLLNALATATTPLVVFVDELQWADPASLNLIKFAFDSGQLQYTMFIATLRGDALKTDPQLQAAVNSIEQSRQGNRIKKSGINALKNSKMC
jgi:serine/threonine protein kinase